MIFKKAQEHACVCVCVCIYLYISLKHMLLEFSYILNVKGK